MRVIKSVSIPLELAKKIEHIPNFSAYIASMIQNDSIHELTMKCESYKKQIAKLERTLRDLCEAPQRVTRKEYIRNLINTIDERHPLIWIGFEDDEN